MVSSVHSRVSILCVRHRAALWRCQTSEMEEVPTSWGRSAGSTAQKIAGKSGPDSRSAWDLIPVRPRHLTTLFSVAASGMWR